MMNGAGVWLAGEVSTETEDKCYGDEQIREMLEVM